ncbi:FGGY-family carbohydrate kinase [Niabella terrae]
MLLLGVDIGTSSVKATVVDAANQRILASAQYPQQEAPIIASRPGWAEQSPDQWWEDTKQAIQLCHKSGAYTPTDIAAIGIAYQMHGLVLIDAQQHVLRNAIIWCDSRSVAIGQKAFEALGEKNCLSRLLNSPGNFTASKLAWVKAHEPRIYEKIDKMMLPGDFIAMKFTGSTTTSAAALSEGIFWDFSTGRLSAEILNYFDFDAGMFPEIQPVFGVHGHLMERVASRLGLKAGIPVSYKAGDQPNNAFSLNVMQPGEVAATAGTSGVIYAVTDQLAYDQASRINSFAHVNHLREKGQNRIGVLLNINGCGIMNRWVKNTMAGHISYTDMNRAAATVAPGSAGLQVLPFGNGAERMLGNRIIGAGLQRLDLNIHQPAEVYRAVQEGIAFAFRYGFDIMKHNNIRPQVIRASKANMFLSEVFLEVFANVTGTTVEFYEGDGSFGAALGAGVGAGIYQDPQEAMAQRRPTGILTPSGNAVYEPLYQSWKTTLENQMNNES